MHTYKAKKERETSSSEEKYSMFIGRWQPWHKGHRWLIDQRLKKGKRVLVCIREVSVDEQNPFTTSQIFETLHKKLGSLIKKGLVKILIIPDIESVNFGRGVGYDVIEHMPPKDIAKISGTRIRAKLGGKK
ncbi:MAG: hypothetical protein V4469_01920 [Patescibacteria group bacterium]